MPSDHVARGPAFGEVQISPCRRTYFTAFSMIRVADDPHFGEVHLGRLPHAGFRFRGTKGSSSTSRCRCGCWSLTEVVGTVVNVGEPVAFLLRSSVRVSVADAASAAQKCQPRVTAVFSCVEFCGCCYFFEVGDDFHDTSSRVSSSGLVPFGQCGSSCLCRRCKAP